MSLSYDESQPRESDWKEYKRHIDQWQERYVERVIAEGVRLLTEPGTAQLTRIEHARVHLNESGKFLNETFARSRRSTLVSNLLIFYGHEIINDQDLAGFSAELLSLMLPTLVHSRNSAGNAHQSH